MSEMYRQGSPHCKIKKDNGNGKRIFVSQYNVQSDAIYPIVSKHWKLIKCCNPNVYEFYLPPMPTYKQNRSINNAFIRADVGASRGGMQYITEKNMGCFPCLNCSCCSNMIK